METILNLLNIWYKEIYWTEWTWDENNIGYIKDVVITKAKEFLDWLIENWHIEVIPSEKKSWPTVNDYIKYIATTEDPIKTLSSLIK